MGDVVLFAVLIGCVVVGGIIGAALGYRAGREHPSTRALELHDDAVAQELYRLVREHTGESAEDR